MQGKQLKKTTPSRLAVANALHDVFSKAQRVSDSWNQRLSPEDAGLAQAILGLCLRRWGRLNAWYLPKLKNPSRGVPIGTQIALCMGLAQLAWLPGVSAHAAVDESVKIASQKEIGFHPHKGLVNSILRLAASNRDALASAMDSMPAELDRSPFAERLLSAALQGRCTPENIKTLWNRLQQPPVPAIVVLRGDAPDGIVSDKQFHNAWRLTPGTPLPIAWLRSGAGMVQDISSQALLDFNWSDNKNKGSMQILDVCAAPGGKTTALANKWPDAKLFALERNPERAEKLRQNLAARNVQACVVVADSVAWLKNNDRRFDLILVDAPCSASGTLQKHPELTWIFKLDEIKRLAQIQENLLDAAVSRLRPGGLLIYSVCSWLAEEGLNHLKRMETNNPDLVPAKIWQTEHFGEKTHIFRPDPLTWEGEGFQGFSVTLDLLRNHL